jgi:hypothetical protein
MKLTIKVERAGHVIRAPQGALFLLRTDQVRYPLTGKQQFLVYKKFVE